MEAAATAKRKRSVSNKENQHASKGKALEVNQS